MTVTVDTLRGLVWLLEHDPEMDSAEFIVRVAATERWGGLKLSQRDIDRACNGILADPQYFAEVFEDARRSVNRSGGIGLDRLMAAKADATGPTRLTGWRSVRKEAKRD